MPQRTSKILQVRLTANKNAFFLRYALRALLVTLCDLALRVVNKMTTSHSRPLRTVTGFHYTHEWKHRLELFLPTVCTKILYWFPLFSTYTQPSQSAMNPMHCLTRIRFAVVLRKLHFSHDDKFYFYGIGIVKKAF